MHLRIEDPNQGLQCRSWQVSFPWYHTLFCPATEREKLLESCANWQCCCLPEAKVSAWRGRSRLRTPVASRGRIYWLVSSFHRCYVFHWSVASVYTLEWRVVWSLEILTKPTRSKLWKEEEEKQIGKEQSFPPYIRAEWRRFKKGKHDMHS